MWPVSAVSAVEDPMFGALDHPRCPERGVAHGLSTRVVPRWRAVNLQPRMFRGLPPIHLVDLCGRNPPPFQMRTHAEPDEEVRAAPRQSLHRLHVEMVEVVVRDGDDI